MSASNPPTPTFVPGLLFGLLGDRNGTGIVGALFRAVAMAQAEEFLRSVAIHGGRSDHLTQFTRLGAADRKEVLMAHLLRTVSADHTAARLRREGWRMSWLDLAGQPGSRPR